MLDRFADPAGVADHDAGAVSILLASFWPFSSARAETLVERGLAQAGDVDPLALQHDAALRRRG